MKRQAKITKGQRKIRRQRAGRQRRRRRRRMRIIDGVTEA